jgi:hypothetical protein
MTKPQTHETFSHREPESPGSDRSFGFVMAGAFALLSLVSYWRGGQWWPWMAGLAGLFLAPALLFPASLRPLNWIWFKFGLLLHKIVSPLVMGLLFFVTVTPIGLLLRAGRKDLLRLKRDTECDSYWIVRQPPGPAPETMKDQF